MSNVAEEDTGHKNKFLFIYKVIEVIRVMWGSWVWRQVDLLKHNLIIEVRGLCLTQDNSVKDRRERAFLKNSWWFMMHDIIRWYFFDSFIKVVQMRWIELLNNWLYWVHILYSLTTSGTYNCSLVHSYRHCLKWIAVECSFPYFWLIQEMEKWKMLEVPGLLLWESQTFAIYSLH